LIILTALLLFAGLAAGYESSLTHITLIVDDHARQIHTHQETVRALLIDVGLELHPEDMVEPTGETELTPGMTVRVVRARPVLISADGREWNIRTQATTIDQILAEADLSLGVYDRASVDEIHPAEGASVLHVTVQRAIPIVLHENGNTVSLQTTATTVGEALQEAGIILYLADRLEPGQGQPLSAGMHIYLERSRPVTIHVDGQTIRTRTHRDRVRDVLGDMEIVLTGQDYTNIPLDTPLEGETTIEITRVEERFLIQQEPIPYDIIWQPDPDLEIDNERLIQEGQPGILERRTRVRYENGEEVSRTLDSEYVAVPPMTKIFGYGTQIVIRTLDTPSGPIEYWRTIRMYATSYSASTAGTPFDAPWYGYTAGGCVMDDNIVAVSTLIPWKSYVYVPDYGVGYACDRGGAIHGKRIDLGYSDENLVLWHSWVDVYLMTPVPPLDEIDYTQ
jgi:uncharacterized protein YabE (DUF348 family)